MTETAIRAQDLTGLHLDRRIRFDWKYPGSLIDLRVTGVIRSISHSKHTILTLSSIETPRGKTSAFPLDQLDPVILL